MDGVPHRLVPWCASPVGLGEQALAQLPALPGLQGLMSRLPVQQWLTGDEFDPLAPHERLLARLAGWPDAADAAVPWAALWAHLDGLPVEPGQAWGLVTPGHWWMGREHLTLVHPGELALDEAESRGFFDAVAPLFTSEGWQLHWAAPLRWYARHESLASLPTASLDRVIGRNPDVWMSMQAAARPIRRLQSEVQMLLYQNPLNEAREGRGQLTLNSFWLSGCGQVHEPLPDTGWPVQWLGGPREALLQGDGQGWLDAWQALDRDVLQPLLAAMVRGQQMPTLTLAGERQAVTLMAEPPATGAWQRLWRGVRPAPAPATEAAMRTLLGRL